MVAQVHLLIVALQRSHNAHGAATFPPPRNAVDSDLSPWNSTSGVPFPVPFQPWCPYPSAEMAPYNPRNLSGKNGQACFWFSNGS